jgi:SAM-dependent methyltransferase
MSKNCRLCHGTSLDLAADFGRRPIAHRLLSSAGEEEETYPFALHVCGDCGLVQVLDPIDPAILYKGFNYNFSSWKPEPHMPDELDTIMSVGPYRSAFEIGCNDGLFLSELRERGVATTMGVEPNPVPGALARKRDLTVFESWVTPEICEAAKRQNGGPFDLVVSRQVIEHVLDLDNFFDCIDRLLSRDGKLFLDMPDFERGMATGDCSTAWEEHVSYFSAPVLMAMLERHGFEPLRHEWYDFSSGALAVLAQRSSGNGSHKSGGESSRVSEVIALARNYDRRLEDYTRTLRMRLGAARAKDAEVVLYGVGVRGCCSVNGLGIADLIDYAVDDQPERQTMFVPGARLPIHSASVLAEGKRPLVVLLAVNNENEAKVSDKVRAFVRRPTAFLTLCSPADIGAKLAAFELPG